MAWSKSSLPPVFVNKILLEHMHTHLFTYYLWHFKTVMAELSNYTGCLQNPFTEVR